MATDEGFNGDPLSGGSYAHLLESSDVGSFSEQSFIQPSSFSHRQQSRILCFGNESLNESEVGFLEGAVVVQKSGLSGSDSSSTSSSSGSSLSKSKKEGIEEGEKEKSATTADSSGKACKKQKTDANAPTKVKKEKLGERITALQKLVSPYGKTDTASVLHEAMGYIKFLHDQVQVLSSPYLQRLPSSARPQEGEKESRSDLRSRGLCLVPIDCTVHVANSNGADFWSPVMGSNPSSL